MSQKDYFLVTGMMRTGTTLLEKLLFNHRRIDIVSQPLPALYRQLKREFYRQKKIQGGYYVLNDLFCETRYRLPELNRFLGQYLIPESILGKVLEEMSGWSGQYTEIADPGRILKNYTESHLADTYRYLLNHLGQKNGIPVVGSKEILVEEFSEYFLDANVKVIFVFRDPRDVITSLNFGHGKNFAGKHRPTLFHIRNWRKSIAIYLRTASHPMTTAVRYEELVNETAGTLNRVASFLSVDNFRQDAFANGIRDQQGQIWQGNSSVSDFEEAVSSASVGNYRDYLDRQTIEYIEYMCWPELAFLGYEPSVLDHPERYDPSRFREPFNVEVTDLDASMSTAPEQLEKENKRLNAILHEPDITDREAELYFLGRNAYRKLKKN